MIDTIRARLAELVNQAQRLDRLLAGAEGRGPMLLCRAGVAIDHAAAELQRFTEDLAALSGKEQRP